MKELSIEEKAKAYDEAIEKAKIWQAHLYDVSDKDYADELNYIFPELKESEGEKIRKVLIGWINLEPSTSFNDTFDGFSKEQILAWLEKQGEQKSFDYENANIPQKDSTWGEEDEHWRQKVIDFMNHPDFIKTMPTLAKDTINWLKSLEERVIPKQKQEWSEDDESNFQMLIDVIKENKHHSTDYERMKYYKLLSWFKSLKERYV